MKQFQILGGNAMVVELPEGATNPRIWPAGKSLLYDDPNGWEGTGSVDLPIRDWQIVGRLSEVTEAEAGELVDWEFDTCRNYMWGEKLGSYVFTSALESLESAILAAGYTFYPEAIEMYDSESECYKFIESRVLSRERTLILKKI